MKIPYKAKTKTHRTQMSSDPLTLQLTLLNDEANPVEA